MDAFDVFRHMGGHGPYQPRPAPAPFPITKRQIKLPHDESADVEGDGDGPHRIAHTLTACCRCRQRKTRCDPTLPRCLPCERSGSTCEYFDTARGHKINRNYVVELQRRVKQLEAELGKYTDEDDVPKGTEDFVRPGGLVRLNETDETPRYLGPSSGIAMTRILMEEAKRYTDSTRISELIPGVRVRRRMTTAGGSMTNRSQSFSMPQPSQRKKSFPMTSAVAADRLPNRDIADKMVDGFLQRGQLMTPVLHEASLKNIVNEVYNGSQDPYQNFIIRMVCAINLQKMDLSYAGLGDSYYLAAMQYFEGVVRSKDLKTLQCLALIGIYSLLTPTRTAVYYVVGLATRICQQLGLADEKTVALDSSDPLNLDMRRRLGWAVTTMEFGLAQSMGRPNGFAKTDDIVDLKFFEALSDENITENGITPGPPDEKKLVAIHFCKMRLCQAEIRRVLYEQKRTDPSDDRHPWFATIENRIEKWLNESPENPAWCKPWFSGRYHTMVITVHRPSPQVARPSVRSALKCFESAAYIVNLTSKQMMSHAIDVTWVLILTLYMSVNTLLWSACSYPEVRAAHPREEVDELVKIALDIIDACSERWPGVSAASQLYSTFKDACLQSYESKETPISSTNSFTPSSQSDTNSPSTSDLSNATSVSKGGPPTFNTPQFGYVFNQAPEPIPNFNFDNPFPPQPTFRSNSIFHNPGSNENTGRRFSYFPPDFTQPGETSAMDETTTPGSDNTISPPHMTPPQQHMPSSPDSLGTQSTATPMMTTPMLSQPGLATPRLTTPTMAHTSPIPLPLTDPIGPPQQRQPTFTIPPLPPQHTPQGQRPLPPPTTVTDWFNPPPPFISPYAFGNGMGGGFWGDSAGGPFRDMGPMSQFNSLPPERQGSLSQEQQMELMDVLENEGMTDINAYLNMGMGFDMSTANQGMNWNTNVQNGAFGS